MTRKTFSSDELTRLAAPDLGALRYDGKPPLERPPCKTAKERLVIAQLLKKAPEHYRDGFMIVAHILPAFQRSRRRRCRSAFDNAMRELSHLLASAKAAPAAAKYSATAWTRNRFFVCCCS